MSRPLRTIVPKTWSYNDAMETAYRTAYLLQRKSREWTAVEWANARGVLDPNERRRHLRIMHRAERLAEHHESQRFPMIIEALRIETGS